MYRVGKRRKRLNFIIGLKLQWKPDEYDKNCCLTVKMRIVDGEAMGIILILSGQMSYSSHGTRMTGCRRVCVRLLSFINDLAWHCTKKTSPVVNLITSEWIEDRMELE